MEIKINLSVNDNISKNEIKKMLLDALFNLNLETTINYQYLNHDNNNKLIVKIKREVDIK